MYIKFILIMSYFKMKFNDRGKEKIETNSNFNEETINNSIINIIINKCLNL